MWTILRSLPAIPAWTFTRTDTPRRPAQMRRRSTTISEKKHEVRPRSAISMILHHGCPDTDIFDCRIVRIRRHVLRNSLGHDTSSFPDVQNVPGLFRLPIQAIKPRRRKQFHQPVPANHSANCRQRQECAPSGGSAARVGHGKEARVVTVHLRERL